MKLQKRLKIHASQAHSEDVKKRVSPQSMAKLPGTKKKDPKHDDPPKMLESQPASVNASRVSVVTGKSMKGGHEKMTVDGHKQGHSERIDSFKCRLKCATAAKPTRMIKKSKYFLEDMF